MKIFGWILIGTWIIYNILFLRIAHIPVAIFEDPWSGSGYTIGVFAWLGVGVWLVMRKKK